MNPYKPALEVLLVISLCAVIFITQGVAQVQPSSSNPGLLLPGFHIDLFENVEAACCKAFSTLDANCWPHMFPLNPFFPPLLKENCARIVPNSPTHK
ncbi:hypothetical protein EUTSA_v10029307mg [Eutrema salsugineum]|uniref:Prolamin-like domain-containing protein n=1 Tax=Eutrema salsugineum TaxID=72664 RepID=V4LFX5_EUTSA|nr:hypothetical protein EUTSA_v10029307mg [Eutrema salsugineum]